jgi:Glycosyltransferase
MGGVFAALPGTYKILLWVNCMTKVLFYDAYAKDGFIGGSNKALLMLLKHKKSDELKYLFLTNELNRDYYYNRVKKFKIPELYADFPKALFMYNKKYVTGVIKQILVFLFVIMPFNIRFARQLRQNKIDILVCNEGRAALTIGMAARLAGIPVITFVRGDYLLKNLLSFIYMKFSKGIICISSGVFNLMDKKNRNKTEVINDGIEFEDMQRIECRDKINIVNVANIVPVKGQMVLLEALNDLVKRYKNLHCYFVGEIVDTKYFGKLIDYIESNSLGEYITFTGFAEDVGKYLSIGSIYVQPSMHEGLGISILEAYLYGLPAVASDIPGIRSAVRDNYNGLLFQRGNSKELAQKMVYLIENPSDGERLGTNGKLVVKEEFNIETNAEKFEQYIQKEVGI